MAILRNVIAGAWVDSATGAYVTDVQLAQQQHQGLQSLGGRANQLGLYNTSATANSTSVVTYLGAPFTRPDAAVPTSPPPRIQDEFAWLRKRVDEVCWRP